MAKKNLRLPEDLVMEILPKLPVKSLVRFKSVSKPWKTLFTTPSFISKQLSASFVKRKNNPLLIISENDPTLRCFKLYPNGIPSSNLYMPFAERVTRIYGPCNGIFCLECHDFLWRWSLILWNPATREVKVPPPFLCPPSNEHHLVYGFGIDPKTDDYKIIKLMYFNSIASFRQPTAEIYNLTTDSWRIINDIVTFSAIDDDVCNRYANGVYYWLAEDGSDYIIICFDMSSEEFEGMKAPLIEKSSSDDDVYTGDGILMINNCLFYYSHYKNGYRTLWKGAIMKENNGVERSWTKVSFTLHHDRPGRPDNFLTGVYGCWKDDEIIISMEPSEELLYDENGILGSFQPYQGFLASYKIDGSELRMVQKIDVNFKKFCWLREYIESIAPLTI